MDPPTFTLLSNKGQSEIIKKIIFLTFQWLCVILNLYKQFLRLGQNLPLSYSLLYACFFLNSLSCLCSANSGPLDNNRRDCNQWWAILAEMFLTNSWQNVVVTMVLMNQYISVMFESCQFKSLWKLMICVHIRFVNY